MAERLCESGCRRHCPVVSIVFTVVVAAAVAFLVVVGMMNGWLLVVVVVFAASVVVVAAAAAAAATDSTHCLLYTTPWDNKDPLHNKNINSSAIVTLSVTGWPR